MSVKIGPTPGYPEEFTSLDSGEQPSPISYLYNSDRATYRFIDPQIDQFSFLSPIEIKGKKVIFTVNPQPILYYNNSFIKSLPELFQKVTLPQNLNQEMLDKIAIIANYLSVGKEYEYFPTSAKQQSGELTFLATKGKKYYRVTLPSFKENERAQYEEIEKEEIFFN
jgi:hypothetical protein